MDPINMPVPEQRDLELSSQPAASEAMLGRVVLLVRDYDAALAFYAAALGARAIFDQTVAGQRFLHLALPAQPAGGIAPVGLWLLKAEGEDEALVGRQSGGQPFLVLYTADCRAAVARFTDAGGRVRRALRETPESVHAHVEDLYGNELLFVQLRPGDREGHRS